MATARLSREVFLTLCAVAWADGEMKADEAEAVRRLAREEGLTGDDLVAVDEATREEKGLADVDFSAFGPEERLFIFAVGWWIASLDGVVTEGEDSMLSVLGWSLRLTQKGREAMHEAVRALLAKPEGSRPARFDLHALRAGIADRISAASKHSTETTA